MKILSDRHHSDLTYAMQRLFEDRLGYELYITVGYDWWSSGYWQFGQSWGDDRLAQQFLNFADWREVEPGIYLTFDQHHPERPLYGVTLEQARKMKWDVVMATVQDNQVGFHRFAQEMGAKYLYQVGNVRQSIDESLNPIVIDVPQEFDYLTIFRYRSPTRMNRIVSFVNLLPGIPESQGPFEELRSYLPDFEFRSYGHECPDGYLKPVAAIAEEMARAGWAYHDKPTGDGFGHVIHNWAAVGRPLIGHGRYYQDQRAECFWRDGLTCIDLDKHLVEEAAKIIATMRLADYSEMTSNIRLAFDQLCNPELIECQAYEVYEKLLYATSTATA